MKDLLPTVQRARAGDTAAFAELVRGFQHMAVGYAYTLLGDLDLAADAAQEALLRAYLDLSMLREPRAFPSWLRRIVFKQCDRVLRGGRLPTVSLDGVPEAASGGESPAGTAQRRELSEKVRAAIQALPPAQREATTLFYIDGYSMAEVGQFLDVPVTTVRSRLRAGRSRLRERMIQMVERELKGKTPGDQVGQKVTRILCGKHLAEHARIPGSRFHDVDLGRGEFENVNLAQARFDDVNLREAGFENVCLADARFHDVDFSGVTISFVQMGGATIKDVVPPPGSDGPPGPVTFRNCRLNASTFTDCDLSDAEITNCRTAGMTIDGVSVADMMAAYRKRGEVR